MPEPDRSTQRAGLARGAPKSPSRFVLPALLGVGLGTAVGGYLFWSNGQAQHAAETVAEPGLDKPAPEECAIARAALSAVSAAGDVDRWHAALGPLTMKARSQRTNPVDVPGYGDDEADNLRSKPIADWRGCAGMGAFVRALGWSAMRDDADIAEVGLARPGVNAAGDEAKVYEMVGAPRQDVGGALMLARGPWLATLHRAANGTWRVTAAAEVSRHGH